MGRIDHMAGYLMPLFCSNKPSTVIISTFITVVIFLSLYIASHLLYNEYDDPAMFKPNSQDYFRTSLLGFLSPFLFYFVKTFIFNVRSRFLLLNMFFDFPLNDWYLLCILIGLAYPQLQDQNHHSMASMMSDEEPAPLWHIIPRQSYIFGLNWALAELTICVLGNLPYYSELSIKSPLCDSENTLCLANNGYVSLDANDEHLINRQNITLSKCVGIRRISSTISSNVYSSELENNIANNNYGSIKSDRVPSNKGENNLRDTFKSDDDQLDQTTDSILVINPADNSLKLMSSGSEEDLFNESTRKPIFRKRCGYVWVSFSDNNGPNKSTIDSNMNSNDELVGKANPVSESTIRNYCELPSGLSLLTKHLVMSFLILGNAFLTIGESFFLSIYFIYVPGHEKLFTSIVNYFGSRNSINFLMCVVIPFSILNYLIHILLFFWNDMEETSDFSSLSSTDRNQNNKRKSTFFQAQHLYFDIYSRLNAPVKERKPSSSFSNELFTSENINENDTPDLLSDPLLIALNNNTNDEPILSRRKQLFERFVTSWKALVRKDQFIVTVHFVWGLIIFVLGIYSAVYI